MSGIEMLETKEIYKNKWMRLREDKILRESGETGIYSVVEKEDFAVIVPVEDGHIYIVEQFRYPISKMTIELPQGAWETKPDADPLEVAKGELREETGLIADKMVYVGYQTLACGYSNQGYHIYFASDLRQTTNSLDAEEVGLISNKISIALFEEYLANGKITDATSTTAYLLAKHKGLIG